ncbi:MAG: DUF3445 domain-containing protein [Pseudomonadota bacterium]
MSDSVLQSGAPYPALMQRALPSLQVLDPAEWLIFDEAETGQLALRRQLMAERRGEVLACLPGSEAAQAEAVEVISAHLRARYGRSGVAEFAGLAGAVQEDVLLLMPTDAGHVLCAALLCFPASWMLSEKIGRPMAVIHDPVSEISTRMDRQIERILSGLRVDRPLWRWNRLWYHDPTLFQPRSAGDRREKPEGQGDYLRSERQCLVRLPRTGCILFTIHTYVIARHDIGPDTG